MGIFHPINGDIYPSIVLILLEFRLSKIFKTLKKRRRQHAVLVFRRRFFQSKKQGVIAEWHFLKAEECIKFVIP